MTQQDAQRIVEALRKGIPPDGFIEHFTVGRESQIAWLAQYVSSGRPLALLLKANYGCGKSHLLRLVRELALRHGYAVSSVTLDARSAVRFNRMDQIMGAVWRGLEVPGTVGRRGAEAFLDHVCDHMRRSQLSHDGRGKWVQISNGWRWDNQYVLSSSAVLVALRIWTRENSAKREQVADWLEHPHAHTTKWLVEYSRGRTPYILSGRHFDLRGDGYYEAWASIRTIYELARAAGLAGLVILFDEFEDVLFNLRNGEHEQAAFANLFEFYAGKQFRGMAFFAVTPGFVAKCEHLLMRKGYWQYDLSRLERLPAFEIDPLSGADLEELAVRIVDTHALAYGWHPAALVKRADITDAARRAAAMPIQDRSRQAIRAVVAHLDDALQGAE